MDNRIPEIYVLWHPACTVGEELARRIHAWLRPGPGLGPEVFYRSLPAPEAPAGGLPPPLPGEVRQGTPAPVVGSRVANMQIVLLLIDQHMVVDAAWRHWIGGLAPTSNNPDVRVLLPVALDPTAFNVPVALSELNFLRPTGLPLPEGRRRAGGEALEIVVRSLLKQLTEAFCRLMLGRLAPTAAQPQTGMGQGQSKVTIFLSHAKADGTIPAKRIRDYIYSQTQLAAFYDENDIPFGSAFGRVLQTNVQGVQTAAMIAIQSAKYATRPWCRRELSLFRRPTQDTMTGQTERWRVNPVLVVDAMQGGSLTSGIPEFGNAPLIRWADDVQEQEEQVVTTVLRDVLLATFHASVGRTIPYAPDRIVLNWLPDPTTLLQIPRIREAQQEVHVFYPGRGLSGLELDILDELFPRVELHSFETVTA